MNLRVLTFTSFGETAEENYRTTLAPHEIQVVAAQDAVKQGMPVKRAGVMLKDGGEVEVYVSEYDLLKIEEAVGTYCLD